MAREMQISVTGFAWYDREGFEQIREASTDKSTMCDTFDEWLRSAEITERDVKNKGMKVVRVLLEPSEFFAWCKAEGHDINGHARTCFASFKAARHEFERRRQEAKKRAK